MPDVSSGFVSDNETIGEYVFDTKKYLLVLATRGWGAGNHTVDEESRNRVGYGGFTVSSRASHRAYPVQEILRLLRHESCAIEGAERGLIRAAKTVVVPEGSGGSGAFTQG
jgi:hypothetical protein